MAAQQDDRISSFVDRKGIERDQKYLIDTLRTVQAYLTQLSMIKLSLTGGGSMRNTLGELREMAGAMEELARAKSKVSVISKEEARIAVLNAAAIEKEAQARLKNAQAAELENKATTGKKTKSASTTAVDTSAIDKELQQKQLGIKKAQEYLAGLERQMKDLEGAGKVNTDDYKKLAADAERATRKLEELEAQEKDLQAQLSAAKPASTKSTPASTKSTEKEKTELQKLNAELEKQFDLWAKSKEALGEEAEATMSLYAEYEKLLKKKRELSEAKKGTTSGGGKRSGGGGGLADFEEEADEDGPDPDSIQKLQNEIASARGKLNKMGAERIGGVEGYEIALTIVEKEKELQAAMERRRQTLRTMTDSTDEAVSANNAYAGSMRELEKRHKEAVKMTHDFGVALGENHELTQQMAEVARQYGAQIKGIKDLPKTPKAEKVESVDEQADSYRDLKRSVDDAFVSFVNLYNEQGALAPATKAAYEEYRKLKGELIAVNKLKNLKGDPDNLSKDDDAIAARLAQQRQSVLDISAALTEARSKKEQLESSGGKFTGYYTQLTREVEDFEKNLTDATAELNRQEAEFTDLIELRMRYEAMNSKERQSDQGRAVEAQIEVRTADQAGRTPNVVDDDALAQVRALEQLERKYRDIRAEQGKTRDNRVFNRLEAEAADYARQIEEATSALGQHLRTQEGIKNPFEKLRAQAKEAKKDYLDLLAVQEKNPGSVPQPDLDAAKAKWKGYEQTLRDVQQEARDALNPPGQKAQATANAIRQIKDQLDDYRQKLASAKAEMDRIAGASPFGRQSEAFEDAANKATLYDGKIKILEKDLRKLSKEERDLQDLQKQKDKFLKNYDKEMSAAKQLNSMYQQLQESLEMLQMEAQELAAKEYLGIATKADKQRLGEVKEGITALNDGLVQIDTALGRAAKNNYRYTQQLFSLQQVLREFPNMALGPATFLSALSNNIPILADDIQRLHQRNKELNAEGKKGQSVWKSLAQSFFSWQTLLIVGVTLLTMYGEKLWNMIVALFRSEEANRRAYRASKEYAELLEKMAKTAKDVSEAFRKLNEIRNRSNEEALRNLRNELTALEALGLEAGKLFRIKQDIADLEKRGAQANRSNTAQTVEQDINTQDRFQVEKLQEEINSLNVDLQKARTNAATSTRVLPSSTGAVVVSRSAEEREADRKKAALLENEIQLRTEEKRLAEESVANAKVFAAEKLRIEEEYRAGTITAAERAAQRIAAEDQFLVTQKDISNRRAQQAENMVVLRGQQNQEELNRVNRNRQDPSKDRGVKRTEDLLDAAKKVAEQQADINKEIIDADDKTQDAMTQNQALQNEKRKYANDEYRKTVIANAELAANKTIAYNQDILNSETATYEERVAALKAITQANRNLAAARTRDVEMDFGATPADIAAARKQQAQEEYQLKIQLNRDLAELDYEYMVKRETARKESLNAQLNLEIRFNEAIAQDNELSLQQRISAQEKALEARKQQLNEEYRLQLRTAGLSEEDIARFEANRQLVLKHKRLTNEQLRAIQAQHDADLIGLFSDTAEKMVQIWKTAFDEIVEEHEEFIDRLENIYKVFSIEDQRAQMNEIQNLLDSFKKGEIGYARYLAEKDKLAEKYARRERDRQREFIDRELNSGVMKNIDFDVMDKEQEIQEIDDIMASGSLSDRELADMLKVRQAREEELKQLKAFQKRKLDLNKELGDLQAADQADDRAREEKYLEARLEAWNNFYSALREMLEGFVEAGFARRQQQIDYEMEMLQKRADKERELVDQAVANEEEKARRMGEIRVKEQSEREQLDKRQRKLEYDRAKAAKITGLFNVAINTAVAVSKAYAEFGPVAGTVLVPLIVTAGALQAAAIAAQPLPKYALGTDDHPGGLMVVGDAWKSEYVVTPDGEIYKTPATPTVMTAPEHSVVYPSADDFHIAMANRTSDAAMGDTIIDLDGFGVINQTLKTGFQSVNKTIKNQPVPLPAGRGNRDLLMKHGADYYRFL